MMAMMRGTKKICRSWPVHAVVVFLILPCADRIAAAAAVSLPWTTSSWHQRNHHHHFQWKTSFNRTTGMASSKESSIVPHESALYRLFCGVGGNSTTTTPPASTRDLLAHTQDIISRYPTWLCRAKLTGGLLRAVRDGGNYKIQLRLVPNLDLLVFGTVRGNRLSYRHETQDAKSIVETTLCTLTLPIVGGLLALPATTPSRRSLSGKAKSSDCGSMVFTFRRDHVYDHRQDTKTTKRNRSTNETQQRQPLSSPPPMSSDDHSTTHCNCNLAILTALVHYRPWLVGHHKTPVPRYRQWGYQSTQSVLHAYIMWRFHKELATASVK
jgi:hypothetical protein